MADFCPTFSVSLFAAFSDLLFILSLPPDLLEENPFLAMALPWGSLSALDLKSRSHSDDGPILWVRPGEQLVPTADHSRQGTPRKKRMLVSSSASRSRCVRMTSSWYF